VFSGKFCLNDSRNQGQMAGSDVPGCGGQLTLGRSSFGSSPWNLIMAVSIGAAIPPILLFFFGQRYLLEGIVVTEK
jgi:hypothetical protein